MLLSALIANAKLNSQINFDGLKPDGVTLDALTIDSRQAGPGTLFCGLPGTRVDGASFVENVVKAGCQAVLVDQASKLDPSASSQATVIRANNAPAVTAKLAAAFYQPQPQCNLAVTGTNGKTSVAVFVRQLLAYMSVKAVCVGTLGLQPEGIATLPSLTSPDAISLHKGLKAAAQKGYETLVVEASSHGLDQRRLEGLTFDAAAFTSFSRDHLDYHPTMESYLAAKARLFTDLLKPSAIKVLNADIHVYDQLSQGRHEILSYGRMGKDLQLIDQQPLPHGQSLHLVISGVEFKLNVGLIGDFQAFNLLAAMGLCLTQGHTAKDLVAAASTLTGVPGRMELVSQTGDKTSVLIDYAHTDDALETVLKAARPHTKGKLIAVFGAGGDRDQGKRPLMGQAGAAFADLVIVTDDNPRGEDPSSIRGQVKVGAPNAIEIGDREEAIFHAISLAGADDLVLIAGKGHESGQTINGIRHPFLDSQVARRALLRHSI